MKNIKKKSIDINYLNILSNIKILKILIILFLIFNIPKTKTIKTKFIQPFIQPKKLYNPLKNPFILIILDYEFLNLDEEKISNLISFFSNNIFIDIHIVILLKNSIKEKIIKKKLIKSKHVEVRLVKFNKWVLNIVDIINKINSNYVIIDTKFFNITKNDVYRIFNMTKGNCNNILKYKINDENYIYLIRMKILRDIFDYNVEFKNINEIINYLYSYPLPKLNYIPISFCSDNKYISFCYTSMLSVLDSKQIFSFIIFYIIIPKGFKKKNIRFLESLYEQYEYFNITFLLMDDRWNNAFTARYLTIHTYFRYSLAELIPKLNKIIYIDVDTICLTDLSNFYNLNFKGKVLLGRGLHVNKINNQSYYTINAGILLLNLKEMRKMKIEKKLLNIMKNGFGSKNVTTEKVYNKWTQLIMPGQAILNLYFYKYIGLFPPKYNADDVVDDNNIIEKNKELGNLYDKDYLYLSDKYPSIKHYPGFKKGLFFHKDWAYFARKSKYFNIISMNLSIIYNYSFNYF